LVALAGLLPGVAVAFSLSDFLSSVAQASTLPVSAEPASVTALKAALNIDPNPLGNGDLAIADGALLPASGPNGTIADIIDGPPSNQISVYVVRPGDSLGGIAAMYSVSTNTILWANNLSNAKDIHPGDTLVILPVSGVAHAVVKGETLASIVKKYHGDMQDVLDYNNLPANATLAVGDTIVIPDGIDGPPPPSASAPSSSSSGSAGAVGSYERLIPGYDGPAMPGYFARPIVGGVKTQGLHGYNAVDLGTPVGTHVMAVAEGTVIVARSSGYNGGYGEYVVINHPNGTQSVYAHLSKVYVTPGEQVSQGELIALSGNTGRSTGPHLHIEIHGATNPF